jgi:hypothetical protein
MDAKRNILRLANKMLDGEMELIEGCRLIANLALYISDEQTGYPDELLFPFIAVASDTDHLPTGSCRAHYDKDYLNELDKERQKYIEEARNDIMEACREVIKTFSQLT